MQIIIAVVLALILRLDLYFETDSRYQFKSGIYKYTFREKSSIKLTEKTDRLRNSFVTTRRIPNSPPPGSGGGGRFREKSSIKLTEKTDRLTNSFVTTRRIPKSPPPGSGGGGSTTHSSGGGTFGGGGRSF